MPFRQRRAKSPRKALVFKSPVKISARVYGVVRAVNRAGLESRYSSEGMVVDLAPPMCAVLWTSSNNATRAAYGGPLYVLDSVLEDANPSRYNGSGDAFFQPYTGSIAGRFSCTDAGTGVSRFDVSADAWDAGAGAWVSVCDPRAYPPTATMAATIGCPIEQGGRYRLVVTAVDGVGLATTVRSNGVTVDITPPVVSGAIAITPAPVNDTFWVHPRWVAFTLPFAADSETGLLSAFYAVGTSAAAPTAHLGWTNVTALLPASASAWW